MIDFHAAQKRIPLEAWITLGEVGGRRRGREGDEEIEKQKGKKGKREDNKEQDTSADSGFPGHRFFLTVPSSLHPIRLCRLFYLSVSSTQTGYSVFYCDWEPEHTGLGAERGRSSDGG